MKKMAYMAVALLGVAMIAGCAALSGETPPTQFEQVIFTTKTNIVPKVTTVEREVWETNEVVQVVARTNEVDQVILVTNTVQVPVPRIVKVTETNMVEVYEHAVRDEAKQDAQTIGGIVNTFAPGAGTAVTGILIGILGAWARMRSYKAAGTAMAQQIETIREFLLTLPDGGKYDEALVSFMKKYQRETGTVKTVVDLLDKYIDVPQAEVAAKEIKAAIDALNK
jgi:hypothetical protein